MVSRPDPALPEPTPTLIAASYPGSAGAWPPSGTDEEAGVGARGEQRTAERAHPSPNLADPARSATVDTSTASADQDRGGGDSCPTTAPARTSGRSTDDDSGSSRVTATAILADLITELAGTTGNTGNTGNRIVQALLGTADSDTEPARDTAAARVPGDLIDLADWYLTLPTGKQGDPDTVENPKLAKFTNEFFTLDDTGEAVVFSARGDGVTTKNSHYPRSELREMNGRRSIRGGDHAVSGGHDCYDPRSPRSVSCSRRRHGC